MLPQLALPQIEALQLLVESAKYGRCAPYFSTARNDGPLAVTPQSIPPTVTSTVDSLIVTPAIC